MLEFILSDILDGMIILRILDWKSVFGGTGDMRRFFSILCKSSPEEKSPAPNDYKKGTVQGLQLKLGK